MIIILVVCFYRIHTIIVSRSKGPTKTSFFPWHGRAPVHIWHALQLEPVLFHGRRRGSPPTAARYNDIVMTFSLSLYDLYDEAGSCRRTTDLVFTTSRSTIQFGIIIESDVMTVRHTQCHTHINFSPTLHCRCLPEFTRLSCHFIRA